MEMVNQAMYGGYVGIIEAVDDVRVIGCAVCCNLRVDVVEVREEA